MSDLDDANILSNAEQEERQRGRVMTHAVAMTERAEAAEQEVERLLSQLREARAERDGLLVARSELQAENANLRNGNHADVRYLESALEAAEQERNALKAHILDIDAHATPWGDIPDEPGWVGTYLVTAGALHRALGKIGHTAPSCAAQAEVASLTAIRERAVEVERQPGGSGDLRCYSAVRMAARFILGKPRITAGQKNPLTRNRATGETEGER